MLRLPFFYPLQIHPLFFVVTGFLGWISSEDLVITALFMLVAFISIIVHELGHAVVGAGLGLQPRITLFSLGGVTEMERTVQIKPYQEFILVFAGPFFGLCLAACFYLLSFLVEMLPIHRLSYFQLLDVICRLGLIVNVLWSFLNLLPIHPLDGGKLFMIPLQKFFGNKGVCFALIFSLLLTVTLGCFLFSLGRYLQGGFFFLFGVMNFFSLRDFFFPKPPSPGQEELIRIKEADERLLLGDVVGAKECYKALCRELQKGPVVDQARFSLATLDVEEKNYEAAHLQLTQISQTKPPVQALRQRVFYGLHDYQEVLVIGEPLFRQLGVYEVAALNALAAAHLGDVVRVRGWIASARELDGQRVQELLTDSVFGSYFGSI